MIRRYKKEDTEYIREAVRKDIFQNVYLYIDLNTYGLENHDVMTWVMCHGDQYIAVVYQYYNSLQLFRIEEPEDGDIGELSRFIEENDIEMISGNVSLISRICEKTDGFRMTEGVVMRADERAAVPDPGAEWAGMNDCREIAELICADEGIGGHYSVELLQEQMEDRMKNWNCKNLVMRRDGRIVSHMATYADIGDVAVLGGLVTDSECRGLGYGKRTLQGITAALIEEGKIPVLYCYEERVAAWYEQIGWKTVAACAKLERRRQSNSIRMPEHS